MGRWKHGENYALSLEAASFYPVSSFSWYLLLKRKKVLSLDRNTFDKLSLHGFLVGTNKDAIPQRDGILIELLNTKYYVLQYKLTQIFILN